MTDVTSLLLPLIRADTHNPGGDEGSLAARLASELAQLGPDELKVVEVPRPTACPPGAYVLARWGSPKLLINAHIDTVPPNAGWSSDPHTPIVRDGRVIGLGAADTKGAIAALLAALHDVRPRHGAVLLSGDEEGDSTCMSAFLRNEAIGATQRAVVCEPTSCRLGTRHRGIVSMSAPFRGRGGHSSRADELPAPVAELCKLGAALQAWGESRRAHGPPAFQGMCMNVAALHGGVAFNVVPEQARLVFSLRPPPGIDRFSLYRELQDLAARVVPDVEICIDQSKGAFATRHLEAFRPLLGDTVDDPVALPFWTEAALLQDAGIDAVVFGPGDVAQAHAPDEWVSESDLERARESFVRLLHATS